MADDGARVLRRCPKCRLLFEVTEDSPTCVVCGVSVDGLALPLPGHDDSVPNEIGDQEVTEPLRRRP
jgi:hypothetical protein